MLKFSIGTIYWGDKKNLDSYIEHCKTLTDDIVIINIELFGPYSHKDAYIINLPPTALFHLGYDDLYNMIILFTKYDWFYPLAAGKRIVEVRQEQFKEIENNIVGYKDNEAGNLVDSWYKMTDRTKTKWAGKVHEEPYPLQVQGKCYKFSSKVALIWKRCGYDFGPSVAKVCQNYRQLTRIKWLGELQEGKHRYGTNSWWWTDWEGRENVVKVYAQYSPAFKAESSNLLKLLQQWEIPASF